MSTCTNEHLGLLLHDYELGLLSDVDRERFELHLYECDYCHEQVKEFLYVSELVRIDPDFRIISGDIAEEKSDSAKNGATKNFYKIFKYLIAAAIIVILMTSVHHYWWKSNEPRVTQTLNLLPARAGGDDVIYLDEGGNVEINFFIADEYEGETDLMITSVAGDTVVSLKDFSSFITDGLGKITIPVSSFTEGHYILTIKPSPDSGIEARVYMFRVK